MIKNTLKILTKYFGFNTNIEIPVQKQYINKWEKTVGGPVDLTLLEVDFAKPWWDIFWQLRYKVFILWFVDILHHGTWAIFPILSAWILETGKYEYFIWMMGIKIVLMICSVPAYRYEPAIFLLSHRSLTTSATRFFMQVDPIFHSLRSTGKILSKVKRASGAISNFLSMATWEFLPILTSLATTFITLLIVDWQIGIVSVISICLIILTNVVSQNINANLSQGYTIQLEDTVEEIGIENLQQAQFIRSVFATGNQLEKQIKYTQLYMHKSAVSWFSFVVLFYIPWALYYLAILVLGLFVMSKINTGAMTLVTGIGILGTYFIGSFSVLSLGEKSRRISQHIIDIKDLFTFIREFGKQTYPVLSEVKKQNQN